MQIFMRAMDENSRRHICIVTPSALGSNPRVVKEAESLLSAGFRVTVVSVRTSDAVDVRDISIIKTALWSSLRIDMRSRYARLPFLLIQKTAKFFFRRGLTNCGLYALSYLYLPLIFKCRWVSADFYIGHYVEGLAAVAFIASRRSCSFGYDTEDFHLGEISDETDKDGAQRNIIRCVENKFIKRCSYITSSSPLIASAYASTYAVSAPRVVLNVFPKELSSQSVVANSSFKYRPSIYWFSQTIGPGRGLETAIRAIGLAETRPYLILRGAITEDYQAALRKIATSIDVVDRLYILPSEPPNDMVRLAAQHDIGLVSETAITLNRDIALTNKLFTFLLAGIPVLMSNTKAHSEIAKDLGIAAKIFNIDDAQDLAESIDSMLTDVPQSLVDRRREAFTLGQKMYNWDVEKIKFLECLDNALVAGKAE